MSERATWGGRYVVYHEVASGGMATVYMAARLAGTGDMPRVVALKKLSEAFAKQPEFVAMFLDEAHLAARIRHPNVVTTYEFLRTKDGLGIVMDLVVGESLMELLRLSDASRQRAPLPVAAAVIVGALEGLHAAHETTDETGRLLNLVHRDVSPHNILVGADGVARVIDFGIAKASGRLQTTDVGVLKGKFAYLAPEQISGTSVDGRTDVYAAGIVLWEAVTGRKLFSASSNEDLLTQRSAGEIKVVAPSSLVESLPRRLDSLVLRALETDPRDRFTTARAMAEAVRANLDVADEATVSAWVRERAGPKLELLSAWRRRIELALASTQVVPTAPGLVAEGVRASRVVELDSSDRVSEQSSAPLPLVDIPEGTDLDSARRSLADAVLPLTQPVRGVAPSQSTSPPSFSSPFDLHPSRADLDLEAPGADGGDDPSGPGLPFELDPRPSPHSGYAPRAPVRVPDEPRRAPVRAREDRGVAPQRRSRGGWLGFLVASVLLGALATAWVRGPAYLRARVLEAAAAHGLELEVERVSLTRTGVMLFGVKASLVGRKALAISAADVSVDLDHALSIAVVRVRGYELAVSGKPSEVGAQVASWWAERPLPISVRGSEGHAFWSGLSPPGMTVEALDVALSFGVDSDPRVTLDTLSLLVNVPRGHLGPWRAHLESRVGETRAHIGLDPSTPDSAPSIAFMGRALEGETWSVDIPRASTFKIGVPAELFGVTSDLSIEVALHAHAPPSGSPFRADAHVGLYGLENGAGSRRTTPLDLVGSGSVAGDPAAPLTIAGGKLAIRNALSVVSGFVMLGDDGVRIELDRRGSRGSAGPALVLDTREWTGPASTAPRTPDSAAENVPPEK